MKKLVLIMLVVCSASFFAQTTFEKVMTEKIAKLEQSKTAEDFTAVSNDFVRIGDKEKTLWLPYYYAAHASIEKGRNLMRAGKLSELDAVAAEAQTSLDKAYSLSKDNAEVLILQKMIHGLKMMVDPQSRFMSEGLLGADALGKAEKLDSGNPRITLLKAEDTYYTPEQFGGSKTKGLELFQKSLDQFKVYQPKSALDPTWGKGEAEYFLASKP
ncbi:hypothetical protein QGN23_09840 [Chryseobacterium gotjawalense]|uniref:Uncharacterized protein n=1 Tax=Chryseobacterium gotjawalense TaxID=3042315 RepID=A0ABY8R9V0_9FLAO|nr:hypothetical protein [Chryseobacterium sp. wdc7]WHF50735.1 hypothetical protein QGN23_09840 [Chryseobacterium sp. wdc7]